MTNPVLRMNEIIRVIEKNGNQVVNARDLHAKLGVGRDFSTWIREKVEKYGFIEGRDFSPDRGESTGDVASCSPNRGSKMWGGHNKVDYFLTLSMAKELAIVENNENGRAVRQYLIKVEEAWNSPEMIMARALQVSQKQIEALTRENAGLLEDKTRLQIRCDTHETYLTVKRVAKLNRIPWSSLDWKKVKRSSQALELSWERADDLNYGTCNAYHVDAWRDAYPNLNYG